MSKLKDNFYKVYDLKRKIDSLFSEKNNYFETANRLPLKMSYNSDYEVENRSGFMIHSLKNGLHGAVGYSSHKKVYFDSSFAAILKVGSLIGSNYPNHLLRRIINGMDNEVLERLSLTINSQFSPKDFETFDFKNIVPDDDEKTSTDHPFYCEHLDLYSNKIHFSNVISAINCTLLFEYFDKLIVPDGDFYNLIKHNIENEENFDFYNFKLVDFLMSLETIINALELYYINFKQNLELERYT